MSLGGVRTCETVASSSTKLLSSFSAAPGGEETREEGEWARRGEQGRGRTGEWSLRVLGAMLLLLLLHLLD